MKASLLWPLGLVLILVGGVWTGQGLGWIEGSPMTDETLWAIVGPVVMVIGGLLAFAGLRRTR